MPCRTRKLTALVLALGLFAAVFISSPSSANAAPDEEQTNAQNSQKQPADSLGLTAKAAVLMNAETGRIIYSVNENQQLPEASITKIMTMLLVFEALDSEKIAMEDSVTCSEYAASMGGSQIWLEPGETMTVHELIKAALVGSANDACVALGEHIAGSNEAFVSMMNERAEELGMTDTFYCNCTGLDAEGHVTSARDIAIASSELLTHEKVLEYTGIWMDTLRDGKLQLTNTNKLIKHYNGAIGLKTGTTSKAGCCISAAARDRRFGRRNRTAGHSCCRRRRKNGRRICRSLRQGAHPEGKGQGNQNRRRAARIAGGACGRRTADRHDKSHARRRDNRSVRHLLRPRFGEGDVLCGAGRTAQRTDRELVF